MTDAGIDKPESPTVSQPSGSKQSEPISPDSESETWWLTAQLPPLGLRSTPSLEAIRPIRGEELRKLHQSNNLLLRLANAAPYAKLFDFFQRLQAVAADPKKSPARKAKEMNRITHALALVAEAFPTDMRDQALKDFGSDSEELHQLDAAIVEECSKATFKILISIAKLDQGPFDSSDDAIVLSPMTMDSLVAVDPSISNRILLIPTLYNGIIVAERLMGRGLLIYDAKIQNAAIFLRQLAAEIPDGAPGLIKAEWLDQPGIPPGTGPMGIEQLALDSAVHLHRGVRLANQFLTRTSDVGPSILGNQASETASESDPRTPAATEAAKNDGSLRSSPQPQASDTADEHTEASEPSAIDVGNLAAHATDFVDSLERAWSDALSPESLKAMRTDMDARFNSLLFSIKRQVEATEKALREVGVDAKLGAFPVPPEEIGKLSLDPDAKLHWRQMQMAQIDALMHLLVALNAMRAPSARRVELPTGREQTWWESGAFAMLRARASLLARISEQTVLAAGEVTGTKISDKTGLRLPFDTLMFANEALSHGDVFGALINARLAILQCVALQNSTIPEDLLTRLAADSRLDRDSGVLRLLEEAVRRLYRGEKVDIAVATLLAPRAIGIAQRIYLGGADVIRSALEANRSGQEATQDDTPNDETLARKERRASE